MFDGAILDVAIGMLLLFLVASLIASAVVETIAGLLHRRSKHLWDTLDLLLGNTSTEDGAIQSIVDELYKQPFVTGLVRPTDRLRFDPASDDADGIAGAIAAVSTNATPNETAAAVPAVGAQGRPAEKQSGRIANFVRIGYQPPEKRPNPESKATVAPKKLPWRAQPRRNLESLPMGADGAPDESKLRRRFFGPDHIEGREFANALLGFLRPDGQLDQAVAAITAIDAAMPDQSDADVLLSDIGAAVDQLKQCGESLGSRDFTAAVAKITAAGTVIKSADLTTALGEARAALENLLSGKPTTAEVVAALDKMPTDLREKLLAVANDVGDSFKDIRNGLEDWYERNMNAASRWYRKQTRWFLFLAGLVMAISLNVDAVHATTTLYRDESVRDALVGIAEQVGTIECPADDADAPATTVAPATTDPGDGDEDGAASGEFSLTCLRENIGGSLAFPIGWNDTADTSAGGWVLRIVGWLLVAGAVTLGAPFWFDLLGRALAQKKKTQQKPA